MNNLFSVDKTGDKNATDFDQNPYVVAHVSEEVRHKLATAFAFDEPRSVEPKSDAEKATVRKSRIFGIISVAFLAAGIVFILLADRGNWYAASPFLHIVDVALLLACIVFNFLSRRMTQKMGRMSSTTAKEDIASATERLKAAAAEAARELGVPDGAVSLEILPYHYKQNGDKIVRVGKKDRFDNISVSAWVEGGMLSLATAQELFRVPLSELRGYREHDVDFEIDYWLKADECTADKYAAYNIRSAGLFAKRCHTYYSVEIDGDYEFFVPGYDLSVLKGLVELTPICD